MTLRTLTVFFWGCLIATAAVAGPEHKTEIKIAIDGEDSSHHVFRFDGQNGDFDFHDLDVGESKVVTDSNGNEVTVLRTENGFEFDVEGEKIEIAGLHGEHDTKLLYTAHESHGNHDIEDIVVDLQHNVRMIKTSDGDGVTIISGDEIDEATREALKEVLKEAGTDGDVVFIDGNELSDSAQVREVRIIKKEIEVKD